MRAVIRNPARGHAKMIADKNGPARIEVRELDPVQKCGPNTSVRLLYRVIESAAGARTSHLVFLDRHGWYCEHGRECVAVALVRRAKGRLAN